MVTPVTSHVISHNQLNITKVYSKFDIVLIRVMVMMFKLIGMAPYTINISTTERRIKFYFSTSWLGTIYNIFLLLFSLMMLYLLTPFIYRKNNTQISLSTGLFIIRCVCMALILLIYIFRQRDTVTIFNRLVVLEVKLIDELFHIYHLKREKFYNIMFVVYIIINILLFIIACYWSRSYILIGIINDFILGLPLWQHSLLLIYLQNRIKSLNKSLESLKNPYMDFGQPLIRATAIYRRKIKEDIVLIRKMHRQYYELSHAICDIYTWSSLIVIIERFLALIHALYKLLIQIRLISHSGSTTIKDLQIFWIVTRVLPILALTDSVTRLNSEVCEQF